MSEVKMSITARIALATGTFLMLLLIAGQVHWAERASAQTVPGATPGAAIVAAATRTPTPVPPPGLEGTAALWIVGAAALGLAFLAVILILWRRKKKKEEYG